MKFKSLNFIYTLCFLCLTTACQAQSRSTTLNNIIEDYKQQMSVGWGPYKLTEYFSDVKIDHRYIQKTFSASVLSDALNINSRTVNLAEISDTEGGYELGLLELNYSDSKTSDKHYKTIIQSLNKNLRGSKIFIGYTAIQCDKNVVIISSPAVVTKKIKSYFSHVKNANHLCN